jgi:hypothetical protein
MVNQEVFSDVDTGMNNFFSVSQGGTQPQKDDDNRLLKKLRLALLFWFVSLILTIIWFSFSPAF